MLIQGDNLESLKALLPFYADQVKCLHRPETRSAFEHYDGQSRTQQVAKMWQRLEFRLFL